MILKKISSLISFCHFNVKTATRALRSTSVSMTCTCKIALIKWTGNGLYTWTIYGIDPARYMNKV